MCEENTSQKERFLQEVEQKLLRRDLDAKLLENGLLHVSWNEKPLCSVDRDGIVRFRPADITGSEVDRQLRTVIQTAGHVKEYMRIFERAPTLKVVGLDDTYKVLADFGDAVLAGQLGKKGARFVTWEWDFDRQGVHAGHYFMENYDSLLGFPDEHDRLYELEAANAPMSEHAKSSSLEYFAEFFAYWCSGNTRTLTLLKELTPETYAYFEALSSRNFSVE